MNRLIIALTIIGSLFLYLGLRLSPGLGWPLWAALALLVGGVVAYPFLWRGSKNQTPLQAFVKWLIYMDMGYLSFLATLTVLRDLLFFPFVWFKPDWAERILGADGSLSVLLLSFVALAIGVWKARTGLHVKTVEVPIEGLPEKLEGYKIAQISDLHVGPTIGLPYVERVVQMVNSLDPNLTVLTGDIADGNIEVFEPVIAPLRELKPAGRALYVPGNHEYYWNGPRWIRAFEELGLKALLNSRAILDHEGHEVLVAGVVDPAARMAQPGLKPDAKAAHGPESQAALKILLSHHPGIAREAASHGFHLQLSGHTHGGQFFPWTLVVAKVHEFSRGLSACARMWVYVNPGTGSWGPPVRMGTLPEITLLLLKRA